MFFSVIISFAREGLGDGGAQQRLATKGERSPSPNLILEPVHNLAAAKRDYEQVLKQFSF